MSYYNTRLLTYPTGQQVSFYSKNIASGNDVELSDNFKKSYINSDRTEKLEQHCSAVSLKRTKNSIYQIARANTWDWFITLTFARNGFDASDYDRVVDKLCSFLRHSIYRKCPDIKYLIVPELHSDKLNYHFHGLLANAEGLRFSYGGHNDRNNNPIFNILDWKAGFTTATRITDTVRASSYITKYITKENMHLLKNKKRYYTNHKVSRPEEDYLIFDEDSFLGVYAKDIEYCKSVIVKEAGMRINYYEI